MKPEHRGQSFADFLDELGIREDVEAQAINEILADRLRAAMHEQGLTKTAMAARMGTSRRALDRLLDPENTSVTLHTMQRAASVLGRRLRLELVDTLDRKTCFQDSR
jgi:antitoxin HicB